MPRRHWIALLSVWPGLPQIWSGQEFLGLLLAALFAASFNAAILAQAVWTEALPPGVPAFFAAVAVLTWGAGLGYTLWWLWRCHPERHKAEIDRLYREAIEHYLQGRWNEARRQLEQVLALDETDADALMQLGTLFVRTGQPDLARRTFRQCLESERGVKWRWEIGRALAKLGAE
jgi:TolA-binding protein